MHENSDESKTQTSIVEDDDFKTDAIRFFDSITQYAKEKIERRAKMGAPSANIFQFQYKEMCGISKTEVKTNLHYVKENRSGFNYYSIFDLVRTDVFKKLLDEYATEELGDVQIKIWHPKGSLNVIEVIWDVKTYEANREKFQAQKELEDGKSDGKSDGKPQEYTKRSGFREYNNRSDRGGNSQRGGFGASRGRGRGDYHNNREFRKPRSAYGENL